MLKKRSLLISMVIMVAMLLSACQQAAAPQSGQPASNAKAYPTRSLEIIAPSGAGGGWDALARSMQRTLEVEKLYSQPQSVLNKTGGGGAVGLSYIMNKKGDDYELVVYSPPLIINTINKTFTDDYKKLTPLAKLITDYQVFIVKADSPYKTFKDLLDAIKKNPSAVKYAGGSSPGSMDHLAFAKVAKSAGIDPKGLVYVPFAGGGEALTALLGGNVAFVSTGVGEMIPQIEAGTVRALAITSPERRGGSLKDIPTVKEAAGLDLTYEVWRGVFGAPGMSKEAQDYWAKTLKQMVDTKTWKETLDKLQWVPSYGDAAQFAKFLQDEEKSYTTLMTELGFAK